MKTVKFGGSSLASAEKVRRVCDIITADPARRLVVVSAPGKREDGDTKVTDLLIAAAEARLTNRSGTDELQRRGYDFTSLLAANAEGTIEVLA